MYPRVVLLLKLKNYIYLNISSISLSDGCIMSTNNSFKHEQSHDKKQYHNHELLRIITQGSNITKHNL